MKPCSVEGCHRTNPKSSMCSTHQMRITRAKKRFIITCAHCGQDARVGDRPDQKYCTATCRKAATKARLEISKVCSVDGCDRITRRRHAICGTHYQRQHRAEKKYLITCAYCGKDAQVSRTQKYCSLRCNNLMNNQVRSERARLERIAKALPIVYTGPPFVRPPRAVPHIQGHLVWRTGQCRICSAWFTHWNMDVTCSTACLLELERERTITARHKRRALKKNAFVANVHRRRVFEADGYRCHICKRKTDQTKQVPHPRAPTIDHVIPLACGGTHEPANVRTACFLCNATKSHRGGGEQFALAI